MKKEIILIVLAAIAVYYVYHIKQTPDNNGSTGTTTTTGTDTGSSSGTNTGATESGTTQSAAIAAGMNANNAFYESVNQAIAAQNAAPVHEVPINTMIGYQPLNRATNYANTAGSKWIFDYFQGGQILRNIDTGNYYIIRG